jgi:hypothetical protein
MGFSPRGMLFAAIGSKTDFFRTVFSRVITTAPKALPLCRVAHSQIWVPHS